MACPHECFDGERRCALGSDSKFQLCGDPDSDTCREWLPADDCPAGQVCENGDCVAECTNECVANQRECVGNGWRMCGQWDTDDCVEWPQETTPCDANQICDPATGTCVVDCTDECNQAGDRRCIPDPLEEGYEICGYYDADDCLEYGQRTLCPSTETCDTQTITCSSTCDDDCTEGERICDGNGYRVCAYYDADPCLDWSGITDCAAYETCNPQTGRCEISCSDLCPSQGDKRCSLDGFDTCGDFDVDPCLEWGGHIPCGANEKCDGGACVEDCDDDCTEGERICFGAGYRVCGRNCDPDSCTDWCDEVPCDAGEVCDGGVCARECQNECSTTGEKECSGLGWRECGENDTDTCLDWLDVVPCPGSQICDSATVTCVDTCSDQCANTGDRECYSNGWRECGEFDSDPCLDWSTVNPCGPGQVCNPDTIQCIDDCFDECYVMNDRQCSGDGYDICGDYDADSCMEWGAHVVCPVGQTCSDGQCQAVCNDECTQAGETVCDGNGWRLCGEYDTDSCLDWSGITYCAYNERCQDGVCDVLCTDLCTAIGERMCDAGEVKVCGKPSGSPCLDWLDGPPCGVDEMCYNGLCIASTPPSVLINEILYDDDGNDGEFEYIELYGPAGVSLDHFAVVGVNGANGQTYMTIPLDGYALPSDGHFVIATSIADAQLAAERDLTHGAGNLLQNDHDNLRVVYAGQITTDALGYGDFSGGGTFVGEGTAAEEANYDNPYTYCLSRGASHFDSDDNSDDFWKRTICTPGWEGPGSEVFPAVFVYGGTSTPAIDMAGNIYTVDEWGWPTMTDITGVRQYNSVPDQDGTSSMAVSPDETQVYMGSVSGLYALDAATGTTSASWSLTIPATGFEVHSSPAIGSDGTIYFGTRGDGFYAVNPDGTVKWQYPAANWIDSSPALGFIGSLGEEYVVFGIGGVGSGQIVAIDADVDPLNVVPVWTQAASEGCNSSPAVGVDGNIYIGCDDGLLYGLEGATGNPLTDFPVTVASGTAVSTTLVEGCSPATVPEATAGDIIYMTSHATGTDVGNVYVYLSDGGALTQGWILPGDNSSVTVGDDGSYLVHSGEYLFCFSLAGLMEWGVQIPVSSTGSIISSPVIGPGGVVYLLETWTGSDGGYLWAIQGHANLYTGSGSFPKFRGDLGNWGWGY
jgi:outer membrane protein assembly factor BamB